MSKFFYVLFFILLSTTLFASTFSPHFYVQLENRTPKNLTTSFQQQVGDISLDPVLNDHTPLSSYQVSARYGVIINNIDPKNNFNMVFTGNKDCTFNIGFFAPRKPKITIYGLGCNGAGYEFVDNGHTLLLYVTDVD